MDCRLTAKGIGDQTELRAALFLVVASTLASCTSVPASASKLPDAGTDTGTDTDTDADTDTGTDNPYEGVPIETCWGESFPGTEIPPPFAYEDGVVDVESFPDGSSLAAMASGKLYVHSAEGELLAEVDMGSTASWLEVKAVEALADGDIAALAMFDEVLVLGGGMPQEVALICDEWPIGMALARYSHEGELVWARSVCVHEVEGDSDSEPLVGSGLAELSDGSLVVGGELIEGHAVFGAGEPNETELIYLPESVSKFRALFVARYQADGALDRARIEAEGLSVGREIAALSDGSHAVVGGYWQQITLGAGQPNETTFVWSLPSGGLCSPDYYAENVSQEGFFIARYTADGTLAWADVVNETLTFFHQTINAAALEDGSIAVAGNFVDTIEMSDGNVFHGWVKVDADGHPDSASFAVFVATWSPEGDLEWSKGMSGADDESWGTHASGIAGLPNGRVAVAGGMHGAIDFGDISGTAVTPGIIDNETVFLATYAANGDLDGLWRVGDEWEEIWKKDVSLAAAPGGAFLVGGAFEGEPVIDGLDGETYTLEAHSDDCFDGFLIRACP